MDLINTVVNDGLGGYIGHKTFTKMVENKNTTKLYRVMTTDDAKSAIANKKLVPGYNQNGPLG